MKVCFYAEMEAFSAQSGIGTAIGNHRRALELVGVEWTPNPEEDFDVLHISTVGLKSILIARKFRKRGKRVVMHGHTTADDFRNSFILSNEIYPFLKRYLQFYYNLGDIVLCPSEYTKGVLQSYGIEKPIIPISNGVDVSKFRFSEKKRKRFRKLYGLEGIVPYSVGHVFIRKGIGTFAGVAKKFPDLTFLWIGKRYRRMEEPRTAKIVDGAPPNVRFLTRWIEDIVEAHCGCDVFLFPSYCENQGVVVLEAAACGRPLLLRDIPVYRGLEDGRTCLKAKDDQEFFNNLKEIVENPSVRRRLSHEALKFSKQHSLKRVGRKLKGIYEELLKR